jgi:hypothetical protein
MGTALIQYLNKETVLEAKIFGLFTSHLGLHTGKVSLESVILIERMIYPLDRPSHAMAPNNNIQLFFVPNNNI